MRPGGKIELKAEIKSIQPIRKLWKCYKCNNQGIWKKEEEFKDVCPNCGETESKEKGKGVWFQYVTSALIEDDSGSTYMSLWNNDISKFEVGGKIHLINGHAKLNDLGNINVQKGKYGSLLKVNHY